MVTYMDPKNIEKNFVKKKKLGYGGDGIVELYKHKVYHTFVAVKSPRVDEEETNPQHKAEELAARQRELRMELSTMRGMGTNRHPAIVKMLGWDNAWKPHAPAIFYEYCPLGDTINYRAKLIQSYKALPEHTLWKLFSDMAQAFDFIHNHRDISIIHGDVKPANILVADGPLLHSDNKVTSLPTFKLADFSRSVKYHPQFANDEDGRRFYYGTWSYGPPWEEQHRCQTPAVDIWSLGATLQFCATGKQPVMSTTEFIQYMMSEGLIDEELVPTIKEPEEGPLMDWWVENRPVVYRPLMDAGYSFELNKWYSMCLIKNTSRRITSADLIKFFVPIAERQIKVLVAKWKA